MGMKFSLIVTAHNEGALLEATLKSVFRAVLGEDAGAGGEEGAGTTKSSGGVGGSSEVASDRGLGTLGQDFEILVMIDRGDAATKECAARYREKDRLSASRASGTSFSSSADRMRNTPQLGPPFWSWPVECR